MSLPISTDWKKDSYNLIFVIIDWLIKMVYYKLVKIIINTLGFAKIIINITVRYYGFFDLIIINQKLLFILKF